MKKRFMNLQLFADLIQHEITFSIDTSPDASPTYVEVSDLMDFTEALNEVVQQYQFLDKNGYSESEITGMAPVVTVTGKRDTTDTGQNFIMGKKYDINSDRKSNVQIVYPRGTETVTITAPVTIANIQEFAGAATDNSSISFELHYNAKPTVTVA